MPSQLWVSALQTTGIQFTNHYFDKISFQLLIVRYNSLIIERIMSPAASECCLKTKTFALY